MTAIFPIASRHFFCLASQGTHIREMPSYFGHLSQTLAKQQPFTGIDSPVGHHPKIIFLKDENDARICDILSKNASSLTNYALPRILYAQRLFDASGTQISKPSIVMKADQQMTKAFPFEATYQKVLSQMGADWKRARPEEISRLFQEDPERFDIFIKRKSLHDEDLLIRTLADKFYITNDVKCWGPGDTIYLSVRKSALASVKDKLGFQFE